MTMKPFENFEHWWGVVSKLEETPDPKGVAYLLYGFGVLEGFEQHDKITEDAVKAAIAEIREGL